MRGRRRQLCLWDGWGVGGRGTLSGYASRGGLLIFHGFRDVQKSNLCGIISFMSASKYGWDPAVLKRLPFVFFDVGSWGILGIYRVSNDSEKKQHGPTTVTRSTRIGNSSATTPGIKLDPLVIWHNHTTLPFTDDLVTYWYPIDKAWWFSIAMLKLLYQRINVWDFHGWVLWWLQGSELVQKGISLLWEGRMAMDPGWFHGKSHLRWPEVCSFDAMVIHWHITRGREWQGPPKQGPPQGAAKGPIFHGETNGLGYPLPFRNTREPRPESPKTGESLAGPPKLRSQLEWAVSFFASHFA